MTKSKLFLVRTLVGAVLAVLAGAYFYLMFFLVSLPTSENIKYSLIVSIAVAVVAIPLCWFSDIGLSKDERKAKKLVEEELNQSKLQARLARGPGCLSAVLTIGFFILILYLLVKLVKFFWYL